MNLMSRAILELLAVDIGDEAKIQRILFLFRGMRLQKRDIPDKQYMILSSIFDHLAQENILNNINILNDILKRLESQNNGLNDHIQGKTREDFEKAIISLIHTLSLEELERVYKLTQHLWKNQIHK